MNYPLATPIDFVAPVEEKVAFRADKPKGCLQKTIELIQKIYWASIAVLNIVIDFFTQGLADFFALETLRHGTSFENYLNIRVHGADPKYGGEKRGATGGMRNVLNSRYGNRQADQYFHNSKNYVHVFADSENLSAELPLPIYLAKRQLMPRAMCVFSAGASIEGNSCLQKAERYSVMALNFLLTPTLKFRFTPEEVKANFESDPDMGQLAIRTKMHITTDRIGLLGIYNSALKGDVTERMKAHPVKSSWGLVKLINPIGILLLLGLGVHRALCTITKPTVSLS